MRYLLDSNVFIQAKNDHYGLDFCPAFWDWVAQAHADGFVFSVDRVRGELIAGNDELADWAKAHDDTFFLPADAKVLSGLARVSAWVTSQGYKTESVSSFLAGADLYIVAHALEHDFTVVTHENHLSLTAKKAKIPNACHELGVRCAGPYEMLRAERATFVLGPTRSAP